MMARAFRVGTQYIERHSTHEWMIQRIKPFFMFVTNAILQIFIPYRARRPWKKRQNRIIHVRISIFFFFRFFRFFVVVDALKARSGDTHNMYFYCELQHENKHQLVGNGSNIWNVMISAFMFVGEKENGKNESFCTVPSPLHPICNIECVPRCFGTAE